MRIGFRRRALSDNLGGLLLEGVLVGLCATQVLDWVSTAIYEREDPREREREDRARGDMHAYEIAVARIARGFGRELDRDRSRRYGWLFHKAFGVTGGLGYVALRRRFPVIGRGFGLAFGAAFFLFADELLMPLLGLTPGPRSFSWKVHARGAAAHVAFGAAGEATARAIEAWV